MVGSTSRPALGAVVAAVFLACGGSDGDAAISPDTACTDAASALCAKIDECAPFFLTLSFQTKADCVARYKINCASSFTARGTSATPTRVAQCARDARSLACIDVLGRNLPESCQTAPGALDDGAVCGHDAQCKNKLCRTAADASCGACSSLGAAGGACTSDDECGSGLSCINEKCLARGKAGAACSAEQPCIATLGCSAGVCAEPLAAGAACKPDADIQNKNPCDAGKGSFCHPRNAVCTAIEAAAAGAPCGLIDDRLVICAAAGTCKTTPPSRSGTCQAPAADGAACNDATGPACVLPALCVSGICTIPDPAQCK